MRRSGAMFIQIPACALSAGGALSARRKVDYSFLHCVLQYGSIIMENKRKVKMKFIFGGK